jgi:hypothetical protein
MDQVKRYITEKQAQLLAHPFFKDLERDAPFEIAMDFAPGLTFWVFAFQDILRLNEQRVVDPGLRAIARHHRAEDRGHDAWFLQDVAEIDPAPRGFGWLFGPHHMQTRDAAYALVAEVFRASNDHVRIALLLTLESAGHVFFERVAAYVGRNEAGNKLTYFSTKHLEVEKQHELFEAELMKPLDIELPPDVRDAAVAMIDRSYQAFDEIFNGLKTRTSRRASGTISVAAPPLDVRGTNRK